MVQVKDFVMKTMHGIRRYIVIGKSTFSTDDRCVSNSRHAEQHYNGNGEIGNFQLM